MDVCNFLILVWKSNFVNHSLLQLKLHFHLCEDHYCRIGFICSRKLENTKLGCCVMADIHIKCNENFQLGKLFGRTGSHLCLHDSPLFLSFIFIYFYYFIKKNYEV
jgi:hypothetical protein